MTTPIGIPLGKPEPKTASEPDSPIIAPAVPRDKPNPKGEASKQSTMLPARGAVYLDARSKDRQREGQSGTGQMAPPQAASLVDFAANNVEHGSIQAEILKYQAEVEAAERMAEAASLLPDPAPWSQAGERPPNANLGKPFVEFDEDLEDGQPEDRRNLNWVRDAHDFYRNSSWSNPFQVPEPHQTDGVRRDRVEGHDAAVIEPPAAPANETPSKGLSQEQREAFIKEVEDFASSQLDDLFKGKAGKPPEWVKDVADWIREIDRDHPETRPIVMATGLALRLPREILLALILDEEQAAEYRRFMERMAEYGDIGHEVVDRSIEKFARKKGLSEEDIGDLKLVASTGIFAATAAIGAGKFGKPRRKKKEPHLDKTGGHSDASAGDIQTKDKISRSKGTPKKLSPSDLGPLVGEGGIKNVYAYGENQVVALAKNGKNPNLLTKEYKALKQLDNQGLPTVKVQLIEVDGQPALLMERLELGSKDIVRNIQRKPKIVGESAILNQRSIDDLINIKKTLEDKKIWVNDLQFLIGKDGRVVISDPIDIEMNANPSRVNIQTINKLIEAARGNLDVSSR